LVDLAFALSGLFVILLHVGFSFFAFTSLGSLCFVGGLGLGHGFVGINGVHFRSVISTVNVSHWFVTVGLDRLFSRGGTSLGFGVGLQLELRSVFEARVSEQQGVDFFGFIKTVFLRVEELTSSSREQTVEMDFRSQDFHFVVRAHYDVNFVASTLVRDGHVETKDELNFHLTTVLKSTLSQSSHLLFKSFTFVGFGLSGLVLVLLSGDFVAGEVVDLEVTHVLHAELSEDLLLELFQSGLQGERNNAAKWLKVFSAICNTRILIIDIGINLLWISSLFRFLLFSFALAFACFLWLGFSSLDGSDVKPPGDINGLWLFRLFVFALTLLLLSVFRFLAANTSRSSRVFEILRALFHNGR
jgi:uncharacterized membrane protein SirB2